jgi:hypothetical protein
VSIDPRINALSAISSPDWHPVAEAHGMPWDDAVRLLDAYAATVRAAAYRQAADNIDAEYAGPDRDQNARYAAQFLRRRAAQIETGDTQ